MLFVRTRVTRLARVVYVSGTVEWIRLFPKSRLVIEVSAEYSGGRVEYNWLLDRSKS